MKEQRLFCAILLQAFLDLGSLNPKSESKVAKFQAANWLLGRSPWFLEVCECSGFPVELVQATARRIMQEGLKWRAAPGEGKHYEKNLRKRFEKLNPDMDWELFRKMEESKHEAAATLSEKDCLPHHSTIPKD